MLYVVVISQSMNRDIFLKKGGREKLVGIITVGFMQSCLQLLKKRHLIMLTFFTFYTDNYVQNFANSHLSYFSYFKTFRK